MTNVIIIHGTKATPDSYWYPWLKNQLETKGYEVWSPQIPDADKPSIESWVPFLLENGKFTEETIVIGHSAGAAVILALLEALDIKIKQAILVAGYSYSLGKNDVNAIIKHVYDWDKIKANAAEIIYINSDNDPWGCNDVQGRRMLNMTGGIQIVLKGEGHMGSDSYNQPYKEFPLLLRLVK